MHEELVRWFEAHRRDLPWRNGYHPYHVWVSEVMLQQTQVETALPYFDRFLEALPTIQSLAGADEHTVLTLWAGLGYYSRARNLHAAAKQVVSEHDGIIPDNYESLRTLPGIGPYMAGAILSIAYNRPYPIVDGNVRRVLSRIYGWTEDNARQQWAAAEHLVKQAEPRSINQALMELGAKVCSFKSPRCLLCPVQRHCAAFRLGLQDRIPAVKKRPETVHVNLFAVVHAANERVLMRKEKGLWEFPMFGQLPSGSLKKIGTCRHTITHHRLEVSVFTGAVERSPESEWVDIHAVPISSLTRKIYSVFQLQTQSMKM